jgi:hypothetical protein
MSNTPVIAIDVDDHQFRQFFELFKQYSAQIEEMPDDWKKINGATADAGKAAIDFAQHTGTSKEALMLSAIQADAIGKSVGEAIKAQKEFASVARNGSSELEKMAKHAKTLGAEVFGIGKFLMKIGTLGVGVTGLGAILSGLGLRDLASSAVSTQRDARSIGVTTGQLSAFQTDFSRYVDPSILNRAADAQSDMTKIPYAMLATGQSFSAVQNESPDQLAMRMMQRAHDWYTNTPMAMRNAQTLRGTGLDQFMSFEEVRRLGAMTPAEFADAKRNYGRDSRAFNVSDKSTDAWYGFERELEAAGKLLKTDLTDRLSELAPNFKEFIHGLTADAKVLIDDVLSPDNLKKVGDALHDFVGWLGSDEFKKDVKSFGSAVSEIASDATDLAGLIHKILHPFGDDDSKKPDTPNAGVIAATGGLDTPVFGGGDASAANARMAKFAASANSAASKIGAAAVAGGSAYATGDFSSDTWGKIRHDMNMPGDARARLAALETQYGLPAGMLSGMWQTESGSGKALIGPKLKSGDQAIGDFQFTSAAWKDWGNGGDRFSFNDESGAAARDMASLMKKYKGDIRKALASYNWGSGNVDRDIAANGAQWDQHLPDQARNYINKITTALAQKSTVNLNVKVQNDTSARIAISTNAAQVGS